MSDMAKIVWTALLSFVIGGAGLEIVRALMAKRKEAKTGETTYNVRILDAGEDIINTQAAEIKELRASIKDTNATLKGLEEEFRSFKKEADRREVQAERREHDLIEQNKVLQSRYDVLARYIQQIAPYADQIGIIPPPLDLPNTTVTQTVSVEAKREIKGGEFR